MKFQDYITEATTSRTIADVLRDSRVIEQSTDGKFNAEQNKILKELNVELTMLINKLSSASNKEIQKNIDEINKKENSTSSRMIVKRLEKMLQK